MTLDEEGPLKIVLFTVRLQSILETAVVQQIIRLLLLLLLLVVVVGEVVV